MQVLHKKRAKWYRFCSLSLTALTVCAFYSDGTRRVIKENWAGLMDTMPTMNKTLWVLAILSIVINSVSLFRGNDQSVDEMLEVNKIKTKKAGQKILFCFFMLENIFVFAYNFQFTLLIYNKEGQIIL